MSAMRTSPNRSSQYPRRVEILAYQAVQLLDVTGPLQVFASANDQHANTGGAIPYKVTVISPGGSHITASAGLSLATMPLPQIDEEVDTLLIAGGPSRWLDIWLYF